MREQLHDSAKKEPRLTVIMPDGETREYEMSDRGRVIKEVITHPDSRQTIRLFNEEGVVTEQRNFIGINGQWYMESSVSIGASRRR